MPLYEVEWTETRTLRAQVLIPSDAKALQGAASKAPDQLPPDIITWVHKDSNPVVSPKATEYVVTKLGRVERVEEEIDGTLSIRAEVRPL